MWRIRSLSFFLSVFLQQFICAQQFSYKNFNTDNGFPSSEAYAILQDKMGYMWFATNHGVARYDGEKFTIYTTAEGLTDNTILRMAEDSRGRIWFIGHNNEICYWDKGRIFTPSFSTEVAHLFKEWEAVRLLYFDKNDDLWINMITGIYHLSTSGKFFFKKEEKIINCDVAFKIIDDKKAFYFVNRSPFSSPKNGHATVKFGCEVNDSIYYTMADVNLSNFGEMTFVNYSLNKKLFYFQDKTLLILSRTGKVEVKTFEDEILDVSIDRQNDVWIGFRKTGVMYYKNADIKNVPISFLNNCSVNSTYRDHEGGIWISTLDRGIFYVPSTSILVYPNIPFLNDRISYIGATKNKMLLKTFGGKICSITTQAITLEKQLMESQKACVAFNSITQSGDSVYACYNFGVKLLTPDFKLIDDKKKAAFPSKRFIGGDHASMWYLKIAGITRIDKATGAFITYYTPFKTSCALFKNNEILISGKKGLYLFKNGKYLSLGYMNSLLKKPIVDMKEDQEGGLWLATMDDGLVYFKNKHVTHFNKLNGLISNICTSVTIDDYNAVWVGTVGALSEVKRTNEKGGWKIRNFTRKNGLNSNEIMQVYAYKDSLWVGTANGLVHAIIPEISSSKPLCSVYINSVRVNNRSVESDKKNFTYDENNLRFETAALTFEDQGNHLFRYRLTGLDTAWTETKTGELYFNRLPSGNFQLEVQAANPDKVWSHSATYKFTIDKPFWFTWWFILLEILLVIVIIYLIIVFAVKRITRKEKEKARINKLLAEYQMKALTSQMNPHFIFNAINSIQNFILLNDGDIAYDYLEKFSRLIRTVLTNSEKKEITLQDELDAMELYIELEQLRFENAFDYSCEVDENLDANEIIIPTLVIQPYIENAIWHGLMPLDQKGCVSLRINKQENKLKIVLTDNGIGRKASDMIPKKIKSKNQQSMGTELTSSRIKLFGNDVTSSIEIIDNYNDLNEATGTTVKILLPFIEKY